MNVLVVDDEPSICWALEKLLTREGFEVQSAGSAEQGLELARAQKIDLVFLDVRLPAANGLESMELFQSATQRAPIIVMTAFGNLETAVQAVQRGAFDYLHKPFGVSEVLAACQRVLRTARQRSAEPSGATRPPAPWAAEVNEQSGSALVGNSPAMQRVFRQIALLSDSDLSVLITGETGTGKELVAAAIHRHSSRSDQAYVPVAPVTFSESLLESELFGHVRGAFTGANQDRAGLFETASGGTILLDEIGDLSLGMQVKLLRVLEQRRYCRVGEIRDRPCDIRVLSATHHDLQKAVGEGLFRQDLLYRLAGSEIHLPPLRERPQDIRPLVIHFLKGLGYPNPETAVSDPVWPELERRSWPGNIRELRNSVERAAVIARGRPLDISDFSLQQSGLPSSATAHRAADAILAWARDALRNTPGQHLSAAGKAATVDSEGLYERFLNLVEPKLFHAVLEAVDGNRSAAAEVLGIHRATLRHRLRRYGME